MLYKMWQFWMKTSAELLLNKYIEQFVDILSVFKLNCIWVLGGELDRMDFGVNVHQLIHFSQLRNNRANKQGSLFKYFKQFGRTDWLVCNFFFFTFCSKLQKEETENKLFSFCVFIPSCANYTNLLNPLSPRVFMKIDYVGAL